MTKVLCSPVRPQMGSYLEMGDPILAVKSDVYFRFQIRHMKELQNAQIHLSQYRPANYGTIMALLMHMLRNIPHSPVARTGYLRDALRDVHYDKVMDEFGTFFLHELDLEKAVLLQIEEQDTDECVLAMGQLKSVAKIKEKRAMEEAVMAIEEPTVQFPVNPDIGPCVTWFPKELIGLVMKLLVFRRIHQFFCKSQRRYRAHPGAQELVVNLVERLDMSMSQTPW